MFATPQSEHRSLERLLGEWTMESHCPAQSATTIGRMKGRSLAGLWVVLETECDSPEFGAWGSIMTLGYDPEQKCYVGTFVASMMTHIWHYTGAWDASGKRLVLDTEGPQFDEKGNKKGEGFTRFQDIVEFVDENHWRLLSQVQGEDGTWQEMMVWELIRAESAVAGGVQ